MVWYGEKTISSSNSTFLQIVGWNSNQKRGFVITRSHFAPNPNPASSENFQILRYNSPMQPPSLPDPVWVARPSDLKRMVADLHRFPIIAVDTESNGLYVYQEQVCLLQFSTPELDYLVDPLAISDLSALGPIFADPNVEKVFHAAEYDILCLKRDFGFKFANLFDTMLAGRVLGRSSLGLGGMLSAEFGLEVDKHFQRANWGRRPLTAPMLSYARLDTHYLLTLRDRLRDELMRRDLLALAEEDFRRLCLIPAAPLENHPDVCWKVAGGVDITPRQAAVLQMLCDFRDQQARYANLPPFRILSNHNLLDITQRLPQTREDLYSIQSLPRMVVDRHSSSIIAAVQRGMAAPPLYPPNHQRPSDLALKRLDLLKKWRKDTGRQMGVESDVILPRDTMEEIALHGPGSLEELAVPMSALPNRLERFGQQILHLINPRGK